MRSLIAPVFCVAALLFVNSGALGQDTQPTPAPTPSAPTPSPSTPPPPWYEELSYKERGQYHPCPASVSFNNRPACLGCPTQCRWLPSDLTAIEPLALLAAPPPWSVEELDACFVVRDHNGQALAYVYFEDERGRRSAAKLLTRDYGGLSASSLSGVTARRFPPPSSSGWVLRSRILL